MTDARDTTPVDTAQLRSWARWCPGQRNLMCLNHLLHRAADEIDRLRDGRDRHADEYVATQNDAWTWQARAEAAEARLAAVEALCDDERNYGFTVSIDEVRAAARGEARP